MSAYVECIDLIGTPYVYGKTDCIWLTLEALKRMGIDAPPLKRAWYEMTPRQWGRDLVKWGERIPAPTYDGDIMVCARPIGFCVVWNNGLLHFCDQTEQVAWCPLSRINMHCSHTNGNSYKFWAYRKRSTDSLLRKLGNAA